MDRKKIIYIGIILIITVMVSVTYFSYAFFISKDEYNGRLNVVVGTLDYKLTSSLLDNNNSITLQANEKARLNIEIESLNEIDSKYELFYTTDNNGIEVGYSTNNQLPTGTINAKTKKIVTVIIKNPTNTSAKVTFGVQGGFTYNNLVLETGKTSIGQIQSSYCEVAVNTVYNFDYTGNIQKLNVPCTGTYKLETWGAQGGEYDSTYTGGFGGYSVGNISLNANNSLYVAVGRAGDICTTTSNSTSCHPTYSYNGGGSCTTLTGYTSTLGTFACGSGGGATHIALNNNLGELKNYTNNRDSILIVSGGGGGMEIANYPYNCGTGGSGGGYIANNNTNKCNDIKTFYGGNQSGGATFGLGSGGGGGGWYGGQGGICGSGGGSSYIGNSLLINKSMYCYDCTEATNVTTDTDIFTVSTTGSNSLRDMVNCPNGYSSNPVSKCAKAGNGYARITFLSELTKEEKTAIGYLITYNTGSGTLDKNYDIVIPGNQIGTLPTPTRGTDYFEGWYLEDTFTTKVDNTYIPTGDVTLYARYGTEVNLNLGGRTRGYPSNTASDLKTKRSYTMNTYVVGLAYDNYYQPTAVSNYSLANNIYYVKESSGYGIGLPMQLSSGNYVLIGDFSTTASNNIVILSVVKYTSDGTSSYYQNQYSSRNNMKFNFSIENSTSYEALVFTANGSQSEVTASNIHLYKLD